MTDLEKLKEALSVSNLIAAAGNTYLPTRRGLFRGREGGQPPFRGG
jgi:hypothetical protein